jgi:hypothetical protein
MPDIKGFGFVGIFLVPIGNRLDERFSDSAAFFGFRDNEWFEGPDAEKNFLGGLGDIGWAHGMNSCMVAGFFDLAIEVAGPEKKERGRNPLSFSGQGAGKVCEVSFVLGG